ncbi:MAG TPA: uroporphyrinogen decarboxylase family protein [Bryobacteraceae bacterium]|nr:uroporphyrinogen decarboxylase family protein [Bryobacteraceae bacterium]HOL70472.1 uroporphyrinogen decarboxylase family protein [Bryobacteraceae bacterium]HPQ15785.1 uroporphyrinogen decarboxylase family protein [Bryobacteraceae bacterium]
MTPRERWRATLDGRTPDRPPCDYWGTVEVTARLKRDLGCPDDRALWECLGIDKCIHLAPRHPRAAESDWHLQSLFSIWGVETREIDYGCGTYQEAVRGPLESAESPTDIERFRWPEAEEWDLTGLRQQALEWKDYPILCGSYEPFYLYSRMRGMERALADLVESPAIAEAALERIHFIHEKLFQRIFDELGDLIDLIYVAEDLGTQESLLMSPAMFRRFLRPTLQRMIDLAHSRGIKVFHHDDGAIRPLIPDLLDIGIDILNPIQWRCRGMDRAALARDFGARVVFHGGIDNQQTLPFGTVEDVRREVEDNLALFSGCKGYIVAPCHNIQANTPTANIVAMYEAVNRKGAA